MHIRTKKEILKDFNQTINTLISMARARCQNASEREGIETIARRISIVRSCDGSGFMLEYAGEFLEQFSDEIIENKIDFFQTYDVKKHHHKIISASRSGFVYDLIDTLREQYKGMPVEERDDIASKIKSLYECYLEYVLA